LAAIVHPTNHSIVEVMLGLCFLAAEAAG